MCYLCLKDNPFAISYNSSSLKRMRERMVEIKKILNDSEDHQMCDVGYGTIERLKEEQYRLSRKM